MGHLLGEGRIQAHKNQVSSPKNPLAIRRRPPELAWDMGYLTHPYFMTPQSHGSSPYKIVYGRPPPTIKQVSTNLHQVRGDEISQQMEQLGKVINQVTKFVQERVAFPLGEQIHEFVPKDQVWSRTGNTTPWPHIGRVHILLL